MPYCHAIFFGYQDDSTLRVGKEGAVIQFGSASVCLGRRGTMRLRWMAIWVFLVVYVYCRDRVR